MQRDPVILLDILRAAQQIVEFRGERTEGEFYTDEMLQAAVLYKITVIGEAIKRLSPVLRAAHPEVPWTEAARMRDKVIHHYDEVALDVVWDVITKDIPALIELLEPLVSPQAKENNQ
jgi:uncharacterized protein with HEPN domain